MCTSHYNLDNLVAIVDRNNLQVSNFVDNVMVLEPDADKGSSFGRGVEVLDGHDLEELDDAFRRVPFVKGKPSVIIAKTITGKGLPIV